MCPNTLFPFLIILGWAKCQEKKSPRTVMICQMLICTKLFSNSHNKAVRLRCRAPIYYERNRSCHEQHDLSAIKKKIPKYDKTNTSVSPKPCALSCPNLCVPVCGDRSPRMTSHRTGSKLQGKGAERQTGSDSTPKPCYILYVSVCVPDNISGFGNLNKNSYQ